MPEVSILLPLPGRSATFYGAIVLERGQDRRTLVRLLPSSQHHGPLTQRLDSLVEENWRIMFPVHLPCNSIAVAHIGTGDPNCPSLRQVLNELLVEVA